MCKLKIPAKDVKGFNYHPSYAFGGGYGRMALL